jgi:hypothetical protein
LLNQDLGIQTVQAFYNEVSKYNFNSPGWNYNAGHFTQLVWKGTMFMGAGLAFAQNGGWYQQYVTVDYSPPGNVIGGVNNNQYFIQNVLNATCKPAVGA